jgi:hypothetical protein
VVTAMIDQRDFGTLLDQRTKRAKMIAAKQVNGNSKPQVIEQAKVIEAKVERFDELDLL